MKGKEILEELRLVFKGKTLDTLLPPLVFVFINRMYDLSTALVVALILGGLIFLMRVLRKESLWYALGGFFGVILASSFAFIASNANSYFLPGIIANGLIVLGSIISLLIGKPFAALLSHLTRNWPVEWFKREDVAPAYKEVTIFWALFFFVRVVVETYLFLTSTPEALAWAEIFLGIPVTIALLVITYMYGIWRLNRLNGPGVDEFIEGKEPPYKGQTRGF